MDPKEMEKRVIDSYQQDENVMILVFAQWCINHDLDPLALYQKAYPSQPANTALQKMMELTVPKEEAGDIPDDTLLNVLINYGNDMLAEVVAEEINQRK